MALCNYGWITTLTTKFLSLAKNNGDSSVEPWIWNTDPGTKEDPLEIYVRENFPYFYEEILIKLAHQVLVDSDILQAVVRYQI